VVEHSLGKGEVGSSILPMGTTPFFRLPASHSFGLLPDSRSLPLIFL